MEYFEKEMFSNTAKDYLDINVLSIHKKQNKTATTACAWKYKGECKNISFFLTH